MDLVQSPARKVSGAHVSRQAWLLLGCTVLLSLSLNLHYLFFWGFNPFALDFRVFWEAARADIATIYRPSDNPFVYPPTGITITKPLFLFDFPTGYLVWTALSVAAFMFVTTTLADIRTALLGLLSAAALQGLALGQSSMLFGSLIMLAVARPGYWSGVLLGVIASVKPQLLLLAPLFFILRREWPTLIGMVIGALASLVLELRLYGLQPWADWLGAIPTFASVLVKIGALEQLITPYGTAQYFQLNSLLFYALGLTVAVAATFTSAEKLNGIHLAAAMVGLSLLASPYALRHDTITLVPACIACILHRPSLKALPACGIFAGFFVTVSLLAAALVPILSWVARRRSAT